MHRSKKTSKLRVTGLCVGNSPMTGEFPHKWPVTRKMFPLGDVIMHFSNILSFYKPITHCTRPWGQISASRIDHQKYWALLMVLIRLIWGRYFGERDLFQQKWYGTYYHHSVRILMHYWTAFQEIDWVRYMIRNVFVDSLVWFCNSVEFSTLIV